MPNIICTIHNVEMREFTKDGKSWNSHKLEDETWCNGKPKYAKSAQGYTQPSKAKTIAEYQGKPQEWWDRKGRVIALCGLANATIQSGHVVDIEILGKILERIETKAAEMTLDEIDPTV